MGGSDSGRGDATYKKSGYSPLTSRLDSFSLSPPSKSGKISASGKKARKLGIVAIVLLILFALSQTMKGLNRGSVTSQTQAMPKQPGSRGGAGGNSKQQSASSNTSSGTQKGATPSSLTSRASSTASGNSQEQQQRDKKSIGAATSTATAATAAALEKLATSRGWEGEDIAAGTDGVEDVEGDGSFADHAASVAGEHEREGALVDERAAAVLAAKKQATSAGKAGKNAAGAALESAETGGRGWEGENVAANIHEGEEWGDIADAAVAARSSLDPFTEEKLFEQRERQAFKILDKADRQAILADTRGGSFGSRPKDAEAAAAAAAEKIRDWELDGLEEDYFNEVWEGDGNDASSNQAFQEHAGPDYDDYEDGGNSAVRTDVRAKEEEEEEDEKEEDYKALDDEAMTTEGNSRARLIPDEFVEVEGTGDAVGASSRSNDDSRAGGTSKMAAFAAQNTTGASTSALIHQEKSTVAKPSIKASGSPGKKNAGRLRRRLMAAVNGEGSARRKGTHSSTNKNESENGR